MCKVNLKYRNHKVFSFFCRFPRLPTSVPPTACLRFLSLGCRCASDWQPRLLPPPQAGFRLWRMPAARRGAPRPLAVGLAWGFSCRRTDSSQSVATVTDYRANCHGLSCQLTRFIVSTITDFMQTMEEGLAGGPRPAIGQAATRVGGVGKNGHPPPPMAIFCHGLRYYLV